MRTLIAMFVFACSICGAETVILHVDSTMSALKIDQFKDIYLGRKANWEDGSKITVVLPDRGPGNEALMKILGKSQSQFTIGWKKLVFSGKGVMPEIVKDDAAVIALVAKTPGAIGYIAVAGDDNVKYVPIQSNP